MFCMNCGQTLPDGAKFCMKCGTPIGAVSPTASTNSETINLDGTHTFAPAMCPNCNAHMKVDTSTKVARCDTCGTECLVQDAIKTLTVKGNVQVGNATINVNGTNIDSLLKRIEILLSDGNYDGVMSKCNTILDLDPTNGKAYLYMLLASLGCRNINELANRHSPFDNNYYYPKVMKYSDTNTKTQVYNYATSIRAKVEAEQRRHEAELEAKQKNPKLGDIIYFGTTKDNERIWWKVLDVKERNAFLICKKIFPLMPYNYKLGPITWKDCTLRMWLNNEFLRENFSASESARIIPSNVINENNPKHKAKGGASTIDRVFLLSISEANYYYSINALNDLDNSWWLRSPGRNQACASYFGKGTAFDEHDCVHEWGQEVNRTKYVRPVLWLSLEDLS